MHKQVKTLLLIINIVIILFLFSQRLYARALHFIAYGDTRQDIKTMEKPQLKHNTIARVIRGISPDFVLFLGDMVYFNEFDKFREVIVNNYIGGKMVPLYPVVGNHELKFGKKGDVLVKDVKMRSRQVLCEEICEKLNPEYSSYLKEVLCEKTKGQSWYSFVKGVDGLKIKFIALNSLLPDDEDQFQWFLNELKQFDGGKIIFEHYPPYSIGVHGCKDMLIDNSFEARFRDRYTKFFNDTSNNIILILSSHEHNYQRICKIDKTDGIQFPVYIVSGGGGAELKGRGECDISLIPLDGFRCLGLTTAYHFINVVACMDDKNNLILKCKVLGLRYDLAKGLPNDDTFERQFVKDRLELIDDFTLNWQKQ